jgi:hypothetical protein
MIFGPFVRSFSSLITYFNQVQSGHRRSGGVWEAEVIPLHLPPHGGIGPVEIPGVQALSLYRFKEAPGIVLVILVEETFGQVAKVSKPGFDQAYRALSRIITTPGRLRPRR